MNITLGLNLVKNAKYVLNILYAAVGVLDLRNTETVLCIQIWWVIGKAENATCSVADCTKQSNTYKDTPISLYNNPADQNFISKKHHIVENCLCFVRPK